MKKEWVLAVGAAVVTVIVSLALIRWFAPGLLGVPMDLQVVQLSNKVPAFFENIFREEDYRSDKFVLHDPIARVRGRPLLLERDGFGPHDILGFRNRAVPDTADVIAIGDSQTYGVNATLEETWPSRLAARLGAKRRGVYSMAIGGWGAVQYSQMVRYAIHFHPRVIVVAFYTGNDPLESFVVAYSDDRWKALRPDDGLSMSDAPTVTSVGPAQSGIWKATFANGQSMHFTPARRLLSNDTSIPAVRAGYAIMEQVVKKMRDAAVRHGIQLVVTLIPTKELVYAKRLARDRVPLDDTYRKLVEAEAENISNFEAQVQRTVGVHYVDIVSQLQEVALGNTVMYPGHLNGHPLPYGYDVIAGALAPRVKALLRDARP